MKEKNIKNLSAIEIYKLILHKNIKRFPMFFWKQPESMENAKLLVKHLFEDILQWNSSDIKEKLNVKTLVKYKLGGMLTLLFKNSTFDAVDNAYPNKFKRWEIKWIRVPKEYWNNETAMDAMKWLIEEKLQWDDEDIKKYFNGNTFIDNNLNGLLEVYFDWSPFKAINFLYPGKFRKDNLPGYNESKKKKKYFRDYYKKNKKKMMERNKELVKKYKQENPDYGNELSRKWRKKNPEKNRESAMKYVEKMRAIDEEGFNKKQRNNYRKRTVEKIKKELYEKYNKEEEDYKNIVHFVNYDMYEEDFKNMMKLIKRLRKLEYTLQKENEEKDKSEENSNQY